MQSSHVYTLVYAIYCLGYINYVKRKPSKAKLLSLIALWGFSRHAPTSPMIGVVITLIALCYESEKELEVVEFSNTEARNQQINALRKSAGLMCILFQYKAYQHNLQTLGRYHQNTLQSEYMYAMKIKSHWDSFGQQGPSSLPWDAEMTLSKASANFSSALDRYIVRMGPEHIAIQNTVKMRWFAEYLNTILICCCPCICLVVIPVFFCGCQEDFSAYFTGLEPLSKAKPTTDEVFRELALSSFVSVQEFENFVVEQTLGLGISSSDTQVMHR